MRWLLPCALAVTALCAGAADAKVVQSGLSAAALFKTADALREAGHWAEAMAIYDALMRDPELEIRTEARFRKGMLLATRKRYAQAARLFRQLLDEKPGANGVRLELGRVLSLMGDNDGARRVLRQAQAAGLPPDVALTVEQFRNALRTTQPVGGSIQLAFAPSNNINRATSATSLATVLSPDPIPLTQDAKAQSGLGAKLTAQGYARLPLSGDLGLLARVSGDATVYRAAQFDDLSVLAQLGPEWSVGGDRWRPAIGYAQRWYGGPVYSETRSLSVDWLHPLDRRTQITGNLACNWIAYPKIALQSGTEIDAAVVVEHGFAARWGGSVTVNAGRLAARDPGYATVSGGATAFVWHDTGKATLFANLGGSLVEGDAALFPFAFRRRDRGMRLMVGAVLHRPMWHGFAPMVRLTQEWNRSTVGIYRYNRRGAEIGLSRAF